MGCTSSNSNNNIISSQFAIGESITCAFGVGKIDAFRAQDQIYVVTLQNWKLAQGQSPTLYLNESSITKISTQPLKEIVEATVESPTVVEANTTTPSPVIEATDELRKEEKVAESTTIVLTA
mmetsp:Transcript_32387/g.44236  ORF Transcript_32387/g.44236 Transcript_32387/m.44236 type:complete len:122 (+) Transcript_32387:73-438(+)